MIVIIQLQKTIQAASQTETVPTPTHAPTDSASIHVSTEIHAPEQLNAQPRIIMLSAHVQLALLAIHLSTVIRNPFQKLNVPTILTVQLIRPVSIEDADHHAQLAIHAPRMLNVVCLIIGHSATVLQAGVEILKFNVTNVSY